MINVPAVLKKRCISSVNILLLTLFFFPASASAAEPAYAAERTLGKGSALHGANGIAFGPDGLLYVSSAVGSTISIPIVWDFAELPLSNETGGAYTAQMDWVARYVDHAVSSLKRSPSPQIHQASSVSHLSSNF